MFFGSPWHGDSDDEGPCAEFTAEEGLTISGKPACASCGYAEDRHPFSHPDPDDYDEE